MTRRIIARRGDARLSNDAVLLVRASEDNNPVLGLRQALRSAPLYAGLPEFAPGGAVMLSTYFAPTLDAAETMISLTRWDWLGAAQLGALRERGFEPFPSICEVWDEEALRWIPEDFLQNDHVDVLVGIYPADQPLYDELPKAQRAQVRAPFEARYLAAIEIFNPRRKITSANNPAD